MSRSLSPFAVEPDAVVGGRYRLGGVLGRGGMAEVHDAHDLRLERPVAVKLLKPEMAAREDVRQRFEVEARAAAGMSHPNAVAVFDTGEHEGVPYLVMERLPGETLADRLAAGPVDPGWLCEQAEGLLDALAAAHEAGIVHRDIKPGNILLSADSTAKITDFGIAKSLGTEIDLTRPGQLLGTPAYLAPERIDGSPATPRSDLWSLGVVLYEALAGQKPFDGGNPIDVARAIAVGDHVPLGDARPDLDPNLVAAVEQAMAPDPADRFDSAAAMAAALRGETADATLVDDTGTLVMPADVAPHATRPPVRRPRWVAWGLIGLIVLLVIGILAQSDGRDAVGTDAPATPTTAETTPATTPSLAQSLRDAAGQLDRSRDGARAGDLATGLRRVAGEVEDGSAAAAAEATGLIVTAAAWNQAGQLGDEALASAVDLLSQVPGVQVTSGGAATAGSSSSGSVSSGNSGSNGKGKGKGKDDD
ncbi:MAG: serine/threonine-protein kinase [Acidimicrobiales bacterium]